MGSSAEKRNPQLSAEERFKIMMLRASMIDDAVILVSDPFRMLSHHRNAAFLYDVAIMLDDLYTQCHIFDYSSNQDRYNTNNAP